MKADVALWGLFFFSAVQHFGQQLGFFFNVVYK